MPKTALQHYREDKARARAIAHHAGALHVGDEAGLLLRGDLLRSAWMFGVGALDAYFCDAYTDVVAATIIAKNRHPGMVLPVFFEEIRFPLRAILEPYAAHENWKWRMAARRMMDRENVLSLGDIQRLFNKFFRKGRRFFGDLMDAWIVHPRAKKRVFGLSGHDYSILDPAARDRARRQITDHINDHCQVIFRRRHDCIHNCDRPRIAPQPLIAARVLGVIEDVEFLVERCDEHINAEFRQFLVECRCPQAIIAQAGY